MGTIDVKLHGGPWHGRIIALPDDKDHFHILGSATETAQEYTEEDEIKPVELRSGMYSRVVRCPNDFEWDGWVGH
jgi:hypothetical protein